MRPAVIDFYNNEIIAFWIFNELEAVISCNYNAVVCCMNNISIPSAQNATGLIITRMFI